MITLTTLQQTVEYNDVIRCQIDLKYGTDNCNI